MRHGPSCRIGLWVVLAMAPAGCGPAETAGANPSDAGAGLADGSRTDGAGGTRVVRDASPAPVSQATTSCRIASDQSRPIVMTPGREILCAVDVGSNSAKLGVLSWESGKPETMKDERQCATGLGLGGKAADPVTMAKKAIDRADIDKLAAVINLFQALCARDRGRMVAVVATQWARDATNIATVLAGVKAQTTLDLEVLTPAQEGQYGYLAATHARPGKLAVDSGSNSFQIAFQGMADAAPRSVSVPLGDARAGATYFSNTMDTSVTSYETARAKYVARVKGDLEAALGALAPPATFAQLRTAVAAGTLGPEIFMLGQEGTLVVAVGGQLEPMGAWITDGKIFGEIMASNKPVPHPMHPGLVTGVLPAAPLAGWIAGLGSADFMALRTSPVRDLYGTKIMVQAALLDMLFRELGLTTVVFVPQEVSMGVVLGRASGS